jgi:hypothetical protein
MTKCKVLFEDKNGEVWSQYHNSDGYPSRMIPQLMEDIIGYHEDGRKKELIQYIRPYKTKEEYHGETKHSQTRRYLKDGWKEYLWKKEEFKRWDFLYNDYIYVISEVGISICRKGCEMSRLFQLNETMKKEVEDYEKNGTDFEVEGMMYSEHIRLWKEMDETKEPKPRMEKYFSSQFRDDGFYQNPSLHRLSVVHRWRLFKDESGEYYDWKLIPYGNTDKFIEDEYERMDVGHYGSITEEWKKVEMLDKEKQGKRYSTFMTT